MSISNSNQHISYFNSGTNIDPHHTTSVMFRIFLVIASLSWLGVGENQSFWNVSFTSFCKSKRFLSIKTAHEKLKNGHLQNTHINKPKPWSLLHRWLSGSSSHTSRWSCGSLAAPGKYPSRSWWLFFSHWYQCPINRQINMKCLEMRKYELSRRNLQGEQTVEENVMKGTYFSQFFTYDGQLSNSCSTSFSI